MRQNYTPWGGVVVAVLVVILVGFLIGDCWGGEPGTVSATVSGKHYTPAYTSLHSCGDEDGCQTSHHPAEYIVAFRSEDGWNSSTDVGSARRFAALSPGDPVTVHYRAGRWTGSRWIMGIRPREDPGGGW